MANKSIIPAAIAGAASLVIGVGAPQLITGMPLWISYGLVGLGVVLLLLAAGLRWVRFGEGSGDTGGITQTTRGPNSPNMGDVHGSTFIFNPPPPERQPIQPVGPDLGRPTTAGPKRRPSTPVGATTPEILSMDPPQPDLPLNGVLVRVYALLGPFSENDSHKREAFYRKVNREIMDKVAHRKLHVWGRLGERPLTLISEHDWTFGRFDHKIADFRVPVAYGNDTIYDDLHFNRAEIDKVWPTREAASVATVTRSPNPVRDRVGLTSGLLYAVFGEWDRLISELTPEDAIVLIGSKVREVIQLAHEGHLQIWGRSRFDKGAHRLINRDYWVKHSIDLPSVLAGNPKTDPASIGMGQIVPLEELLISKADFERTFGGSANAGA